MPVLVVGVTRSLLVVTPVVASPFQMRVDDQFLAIVDNWRRHFWSVVVFHGKDRGLVGLYQTKQEADEVAHEYPPFRPAARQCLRWQGSRSRNSGVRWAHALRPSGRLSARVLPAAAEA